MKIEEWFELAANDNLQQLQKCFQKFIKKVNSEGQTALMIAAKCGAKQCVEFLSKHEQGITDTKGQTALIIAAQNNKYECIPFLQAEMKMKDKQGVCALHHAAKLGFADSVKLLLEEAFIMDNSGKTPLCYTESLEIQEIIKSSQKQAQFEFFSLDDWFSYANCGYLGLLKANSERFQNQKNKKGQTALITCVINNQKDCVELLSHFECGQVDREGKTALMHATLKGLHELIPFLKKELKMKDKAGRTALFQACMGDDQSNLECVKQLLEESTITYNNRYTPMYFATIHKKHEYVEVIKEYLRTAKIEIEDLTSWFIIAQGGNLAALQAHVEQYKKLKNNEGMTALMIVAKEGYLDCVEFLTQHELDIFDQKKQTALMLAVYGNQHQCIQPLIKLLKKQDDSGKTALHIACILGHLECAKLLLEECTISDKNGEIPIQTAHRHGKQNLVTLIEEYQRENKIEVNGVELCKKDLEQKTLGVENQVKELQMQMELKDQKISEIENMFKTVQEMYKTELVQLKMEQEELLLQQQRIVREQNEKINEMEDLIIGLLSKLRGDQ